MQTSTTKKIFYKTALISILMVWIVITVLAVYNIILWTEAPDFGFGFRNATGIKIVGVLREHGRQAGLKEGDRILLVNNVTYDSYLEFNSAKNWGPQDKNTYLIQRKGRQFKVTISNTPYGFRKTFNASGLPFLVGLSFALIGVIVFLMKPYQRTSWIFFIANINFGILLTFLFKVSVLRPYLLDNFITVSYCFFPATMIHLALSFPEERHILEKYPFVQVIPYIVSLLLFISIRIVTPTMVDAPTNALTAVAGYMLFGVLFFLASCVQHRFWSPSEIVKRRARMILLGFAIAALLPVMDFAISAFFHVYLIPSFNIYLPFFIAFPSFIAFAIVKHDLFDIDVIIKRTYGYVITTGAIAGIYGIFVLISNLAFGSFDFAKSQVFPLIFILAMVFLFNPIRNRVQQFNDRLFYRLEYDYQETVEKIGETMRSLLNLNDIGESIMQFALKPMFIDTGSVMILNREKTFYDCLIHSGESEQRKETHHSDEPNKQAVNKSLSKIECSILSIDEPFMRKMAERKKTTTIYDIWEDPFFESDRYACVKIFDQLGATLVVPLIYEDRLTGIISVGRKKSGKFYRHEDINLLNTLANQGAMAIENAKMVDELIEKERLKTKILDAFGKYVTHEVRDQILEGRIPLDGETKDVTVLFADLRDFTTLAESTPPKEVIKIINGYFSEMADAIGQYHGLVLQFIGDEIEAVFGAPLSLENHPTHAVRAALAMRERLVLVNDKLQQQGYRHLSHGIGIHTGNVVAANIGSEDRLSYALVGDTVNVASRIQGLNKKFNTDILISATTRARLEAGVYVEKLPATTVKGKVEPVEIFKLIQV